MTKRIPSRSPPFSNLVPSQEMFNLTQSMDFDTYTSVDADALRLGLLVALGIPQEATDTTMQILGCVCVFGSKKSFFFSDRAAF